jgi:7,8-dihydropterin-6-yl-methyl-4-(beta-D-ribofuranosyl)aminobenzene 5'-phosphate synthase
MRKATASMLVLLLLVFADRAFAEESPARITILYDAFGKTSNLTRGWGYSALIEYAGKRILFDTGGNKDDFAANVKLLGIDLTRLDFVVLSHRHIDHTSGLNYVLSVNPGVKIFTPGDPALFGSLGSGSALMKLIQRKVDEVPQDMRYFNGQVPAKMAGGTPWPGAQFSAITALTEVLPGFFLFSTQSDMPGTREMN